MEIHVTTSCYIHCNLFQCKLTGGTDYAYFSLQCINWTYSVFGLQRHFFRWFQASNSVAHAVEDATTISVREMQMNGVAPTI